MDITIKGRYENGQLTLEEAPPVEVADVLVTFTKVTTTSNALRFGYGKGTFSELPADFNAPLEELKEYM